MLNRHGYTLIEMVIVMALLAVVVAVAVPSGLKSSPQMQVDLAARALARDLDNVRMRAIAAKRRVRFAFDVSDRFYTAYLDVTPERSREIAETTEEVHASKLLVRGSRGGTPGVELPNGVVFGAGDASTGPLGGATADAVALADDRVEFDARGMVTPAGAGGVILLTHEEDPSAVAAVTISGAGAFRAWRYRDGKWGS